MMHTVLLIWKTSKTYNTNARLVCLIREICNALIRVSLAFVNGEKIFTAIEENVPFEALQVRCARLLSVQTIVITTVKQIMQVRKKTC
jgi:hypothetical protein